MAPWNGLGQAATLAQLAGLDVGGLISMIIQAVQTVHRNKEECQQLVHHVMMIGDLLQMLHQSDMMRRPETRRPLDGLEETLRQAYMLVMSCRESNVLYRFFMAGNQAQQFRDVRDRIDSYLRIYPLISHIDTRYFIHKLYSRAPPSGTHSQVSSEVLGSLTSHSNPYSRIQESAFGVNGTEAVKVGAVNEPFAVAEQQQEVLSYRKPQFSWLGRWTQKTSSTGPIHRIIGNQVTDAFTLFEFSHLTASTNNFSSDNIIGRGAYGDVYKGVLSNGITVAIKTGRGERTYALSDFRNEVKIIPKLQHANIVKLLGCCTEGDNMILVYEYLPSGSLHYRFHEFRAGVSLAWPLRFRIIEGIAQGVAYLHQHSRLRVVHGDLKPSNILLDCDMTPRITDFGMAEVLSSEENEKEKAVVAGTRGYVDPEFFVTMTISIKSDVYAFGVVLLQLITAQHTFKVSTEKEPLVVYARKLWSSGRQMELIDPSLRDEPNIREILRCIQIALLCAEVNRTDRPTMTDVLMMLKCERMTLGYLQRWWRRKPQIGC